jgi:hypothetical protein
LAKLGLRHMSTCYKFKGSLEKNLKLNQNLPRDAFHFGSIRELIFFFQHLKNKYEKYILFYAFAIVIQWFSMLNNFDKYKSIYIYIYIFFFW